MMDLFHAHPTLIVGILCALIGLSVFYIERWRDRRALRAGQFQEAGYIWQCVQFHGGGSVYTPSRMSKADACEWASKLGHIAYVDDTHHKIFYRSRT